MPSQLSALNALMGCASTQLFGRRPSQSDSDHLRMVQIMVQALLERQRRDLDCFCTRATMLVSALEEARRAAASGSICRLSELQAKTIVVQDFLASAVLYRDKWTRQVASLKQQFPLTVQKPVECGMVALESLSDQLVVPEKLLNQALTGR